MEQSNPNQMQPLPRHSRTWHTSNPSPHLHPQPHPSIYQELPDHNSIRILTLDPSLNDSVVVSGSLSTETLDTLPQYEAISYTWGTDTLTHRLQLDSDASVYLPLTASIYNALRCMRLKNRPRRLWADQVCINQQDVAERSQQVKLMNQIYRGAQRVLVWLGTDPKRQAEAATNKVRELDEIFLNEDKLEVFRRDHVEGLGDADPKEWAALSSLTKLPWFSRLWIVQEIGTGRDATLHWGQSSLEWATLYRVVAVLTQDFHHLRSRFQIFTPTIRYLHNRFVPPEEEYDEYHNRGNFIYELTRARHLQTKDPRDHIYGFLGHFSIQTGSRNLVDIVPDYSKPVEDIFLDVAVRDLKGAKTLILLSACQTARPVSKYRRLTMPSFVPDWRTLPVQILGTPYTPHRAAGDTLPRLSFSSDFRTLKIQGVRIDRIARYGWTMSSRAFDVASPTSPPATPYNPEASSGAYSALRMIEHIWREICGFKDTPFSLDQMYRSGTDSAFFAFVQTLTNAGIGIDRNRNYHDIPSSENIAHAAAFLVSISDELTLPISEELRALAQEGNAYRWSREATLVSRWHRFAATHKGYYMLGPADLQRGDVLVVLFGGRTPFLLRQMRGGKWKLMGECYAHGLMDGEGLEGLANDEFETFEIE